MAAGSAVLTRVQTILQDKTAIRWPLSELVNWLNDGLREVVTLKPSANTKSRIFNLVQGSRQTLPASTAVRIVRPVKNVSTGNAATAQGRRIITAVPREVLDSQNPDWQDPSVMGSAALVTHITFDPDDPLAYYVYPPNNGDGHVELLVAALPASIEATGPREAMASYNAQLDIPHIHLNALVDYVCFRAYSKDNDVSGNVERAALHYQAFAANLGVQASFEASSNPNTVGRSTDLAT